MKNEYLEKICETEQSWRAATKAEQLVGGAFVRSKEKGFNVVTLDESLRKIANNFPDFVKVMKAAKLTEIYYIADWSNWLGDALRVDEAGLKLRGIVRLENPGYKKNMDRYGEPWGEPEIIPALRFCLEEV